jgi:hypothetical protein
MRGCLPPSRDIRATTTTAALVALACACAPRTLVIVDPDPCADGGTANTGCVVPDPCADGGLVNGVPGCVPPGLLDDLVGYWRLDDGTGSTVANDLTGANHGTLVDLDAATDWTTGRAAGALNVAAAGYVNVPRSVSIDSITDRVTIAGWAYLDAASPIMDYATIASREDGTTIDQHYHISIDMLAGVPVFFLKTESGLPRLTIPGPQPTPVPRLTWIHIAGTYDGSIARLYVNGQEVDSEAVTGRFRPDNTPFILGANGNGPDLGVTERFPGRVDEIMLYRRALSAAEIGMLHAGALFSPQFRSDGGARD